MLNGVIIRALIALATANLAFPENKLALGRANAAGSEARVGAATVGYIFDPDSRSLRLITGRIGAALLRSPLDLEVKLSSAAVSPRQDYALGIAAESGEVFLLPFDRGISAARAIGGVADQLALSPGGSSAVLYSAASRSLKVITGLPGGTRIALTIDMMNLPESVSSIAVSDDGLSVLVAVRAEHGSDLYLAEGSAGLEHLGPAGDIASIQFLHDRSDALIADRKEKRLYRLIGRGLHDMAAESITDPIALGVLPGNRRAFLANADSSQIVSIDLDTGRASALSCECKPQRMSPLGPRSLFQLSDPGSGTLWVLDASANEPRLAFVPPEFRSGGSGR
jgi:hypothetical protein